MVLPKKIRKAISRRRERLKAHLLDIGAPVRHSVMKTGRDIVKVSLVTDPEMWNWARGFLAGMVDSCFHDIEQEIERMIEASLLKAEKQRIQEEEWDCSTLSYYSVRGFVLNHWLPYNRSWFGQVKDPAYLVMLAITYFNIFPGLRVCFYAMVLFMLRVPGPPDEYQIINFILTFKRTQFVSQGVFSSLNAAIEYFSCWTFHKHRVKECIDTSGPGQSTSALIDYVGSILLVWTAFLLLPRAVKGIYYKGRKRSVINLEQFQDPEEPASPDSPTGTTSSFFSGISMPFRPFSRFGPSSFFWGESHNPRILRKVFAADPTRGGRLGKLLRYDLKAFMASSVLLVLLTFMSPTSSGALSLNSPQMKANLFWAKVLYAYLSLPFFVFAFPLASMILTHADPTGFTERGTCVAFILQDEAAAPADEKADDDSPKAAGRGSGWGSIRFDPSQEDPVTGVPQLYTNAFL